MQWELSDLVSPADIAEECGVGKAAVSNWISRYPDFPRPLVTVAKGYTQLFSRRAVIDWYTRKVWQHDGPWSSRRYRPAQLEGIGPS